MKRVLDVENSITLRDGKIYNDPYEAANTLTQVGVLCLDTTDKHILNFDHDEATDTDGNNSCRLQRLLNSTTLLILHNAQYDLCWLWASGFKYNGDIYDTMLAEYVLLRGLKEPLSLEQCAIRRQLHYQKDDTLKTITRKDTIQMKYRWMNSAIILSMTCALLASCTVPQLQTTKPLLQPHLEPFVMSHSELANPSPECQCQESGWINQPSHSSLMSLEENSQEYKIVCTGKCEHSWEPHP